MYTQNVPLLKSMCCNSTVRTSFDQVAVVEIYEDGRFREVKDFIDPDNCRDYYWCKECGGEVPVLWNQEEKKYYLTIADELIFNSWNCVYVK